MKKSLWFLLVVTSSQLNAADFRSGSLSYLNGSNYKVVPEKQQTITFDYVAVWQWGDMYMFVDSTSFNNAGSTYYGEFSPRIKINEFSGDSFISKMFLAATFERGKNGLESNLYGVGFDFNVEALNYLTANFYQRDNPDVAGKGYQMTSTFSYSSPIGGIPILFDGYIDWTFSSDESEENFHLNPQIKIDMKQWLKTKQQWYVGIEYDYWQNKFGLEDSSLLDSNQNTFSFLIKWHF